MRRPLPTLMCLPRLCRGDISARFLLLRDWRRGFDAPSIDLTDATSSADSSAGAPMSLPKQDRRSAVTAKMAVVDEIGSDESIIAWVRNGRDGFEVVDVRRLDRHRDAAAIRA